VLLLVLRLTIFVNYEKCSKIHHCTRGLSSLKIFPDIWICERERFSYTHIFMSGTFKSSSVYTLLSFCGFGKYIAWRFSETCWYRCIPSANCTKRKLSTIIEHSNVPDYKRNENAVAGVESLNFPVVNKSVTAKIKKVELSLQHL